MSNVIMVTQKIGHWSNFVVQLLTKIEVTLDEKLWMKLLSILNLHKIIGHEFVIVRTILSWWYFVEATLRKQFRWFKTTGHKQLYEKLLQRAKWVSVFISQYLGLFEARYFHLCYCYFDRLNWFKVPYLHINYFYLELQEKYIYIIAGLDFKNWTWSWQNDSRHIYA